MSRSERGTSRSERVAPRVAKPEPGLLRIVETIAAGCALGLLVTRPRWGLRVLSLLSARHRLAGAAGSRGAGGATTHAATRH